MRITKFRNATIYVTKYIFYPIKMHPNDKILRLIPHSSIGYTNLKTGCFKNVLLTYIFN